MHSTVRTPVRRIVGLLRYYSVYHVQFTSLLTYSTMRRFQSTIESDNCAHSKCSCHQLSYSDKSVLLNHFPILKAVSDYIAHALFSKLLSDKINTAIKLDPSHRPHSPRYFKTICNMFTPMCTLSTMRSCLTVVSLTSNSYTISTVYAHGPIANIALIVKLPVHSYASL